MKGEWKIYKSADNVSERIPPEGRSYLWNIWVVDKSNKAIAQIHSNNNDVLEANSHLIVAAVNACTKLNPDNPQAVAESITDMYEALETTLKNLEDGFANKNLSLKTMISKVLSKVDRKG